MTKENVLRNYKEAVETGDNEYAESLRKSFETSWPDVPFSEKKEKSKKVE